MGVGEPGPQPETTPPRAWWVRGASLSVVTAVVVAGTTLMAIGLTETDRRRAPDPKPWHLQMVDSASAPACRYLPGETAADATPADRTTVAAVDRLLSEISCGVSPTSALADGAIQWNLSSGRLRAWVVSSESRLRLRPGVVGALAAVTDRGVLSESVALAGLPIASVGDRSRDEFRDLVILSGGGYIVGLPDGGPTSWVPKTVADWWDEHRRAAAPLGRPLSSPRVERGTLVQEFEHGRVRTDDETIEGWAAGRGTIEVELDE